MATAVRKPIPSPVPTEIVLTLSEAEAETLRAIIYRVGGDPKGRRGHASDINTALAEQDVRLITTDYDDTHYKGAIYFKETITDDFKETITDE